MAESEIAILKTCFTAYVRTSVLIFLCQGAGLEEGEETSGRLGSPAVSRTVVSSPVQQGLFHSAPKVLRVSQSTSSTPSKGQHIGTEVFSFGTWAFQVLTLSPGNNIEVVLPIFAAKHPMKTCNYWLGGTVSKVGC